MIDIADDRHPLLSRKHARRQGVCRGSTMESEAGFCNRNQRPVRKYAPDPCVLSVTTFENSTALDREVGIPRRRRLPDALPFTKDLRVRYRAGNSPAALAGADHAGHLRDDPVALGALAATPAVAADLPTKKTRPRADPHPGPSLEMAIRDHRLRLGPERCGSTGFGALPTLPYYASFAKVLQHFQGAFMGSVVARNDTFIAGVDLMV